MCARLRRADEHENKNDKPYAAPAVDNSILPPETGDNTVLYIGMAAALLIVGGMGIMQSRKKSRK